MPGFILSPLMYVDCKKYTGRTPACDLRLVASTGPVQLGSQCLADPNCKAFLTNGWLKSASDPTVLPGMKYVVLHCPCMHQIN